MEDGQTVCPACGKEDTLQPAALETPAQEAPVEEAGPELSQEAPAAEEKETEAPAEKTEATEEAPAAEEKTVEDNVPTANEEDFEG